LERWLYNRTVSNGIPGAVAEYHNTSITTRHVTTNGTNTSPGTITESDPNGHVSICINISYSDIKREAQPTSE